MITVLHAKKYYGLSRGIEDVSLEVQPGEIFGFVGPNGSGKTTLIRAMLGLISLSEGEIHLFGHPIYVGMQHHLKDVGYMPSESYFFNEMNVKSILAFFKSMQQVDELYVTRLIDVLDLDVEKKFGSLSFGNKKKVGIVIAMMHQPKLLILDEPTSGLDPRMQHVFLDLILEQKRLGKTIFLSSHMLSEIEKVCDRVALIKEGKILFTRHMTDIRKEESKRIIIWPNYQNMSLEGLTYIKDEIGCSHYTYQGDIQTLMQYLSQYRLMDLVIRNIDLEELFSVYYEKEDR